jgi:hypothetical protein
MDVRSLVLWHYCFYMLLCCDYALPRNETTLP